MRNSMIMEAARSSDRLERISPCHQRAIGEPDYEIRTAGNGAEAINVSMIRSRSRHMDITMPEMTD